MRITVAVENRASAPLVAEHGLALLVEYDGMNILFDTGAGTALLPNLAAMGISPDGFDRIVLSHGHYDHSGALAQLAPRDLWLVAGAETRRFSRHPGVPVRDIAMPERCVTAIRSFRCHEVSAFTEIAAGVFLTGPIPRRSGEDCGGPFFLDAAGTVPDPISDEQAMLTADGVLIQGCCHSGIVNTLDFCCKEHPEIHINTVVGGLHLLNSGPERLEMTAAALRLHGVETLAALHCSGDGAVDFLRRSLPSCRICQPVAGDVLTF
ncbi:MAG: MBL fold metallo-hydrolase [Victivallaceae bacterium]|nr:MBL fold metallo-hydrolase [Victivallaceae bacterium]